MARHGDKLRLHPPAGRIFRIVEAARERNALELRQLLEDLSLFILRQVFQDGDRVVGLQFTHALGDRLRRQLLENFLAHIVIDFRKGCEVEIDAQQFDKPLPLVGRQCLDQRAHVGFMQAADQRLQSRAVGCLDPARDALDEGLADRAILVARKLRSGLDVVHLFLVEHIEGLSAEN